MIEAIGLTSACLRDGAPAVDHLTFRAHSGHVTGLLGGPGSGTSTALRLMLELEPAKGVTLFRGRPLHRIGHPAQEVGVLLGDPASHPARSARGHLRMLCAAAAVPASRADEVLELVGLSGAARLRLGAFSLGMERRLGVAAALLGDPHTLVLEQPALGLSPQETAWLRVLLRAFAARGGTVLVTGSDSSRLASLADRVLAMDDGRLVADLNADEFIRTRLRPRIVVRSPQAPRLARLLAAQGLEVVRETGSRLGVFGGTLGGIGDTAHSYGIPLHELADRILDTGPPALPDPPQEAPEDDAQQFKEAGAPAEHRPPPLPAPPLPGPTWLLRYEWRRLTGIPSTWLITGAVLVAHLLGALLLASGAVAVQPPTPTEPKAGQRLLTAWLPGLPLPPAALGAGLLGALAFGHEFRYPALAHVQAPIRLRIRLLAAKLATTGCWALLVAAAALLLDTEVVRYAAAAEGAAVPQYGAPPGAALALFWMGLVTGCAWAGLLAAGVFRSSLVGALAVLAVPVLAAPAVQAAMQHPVAGPALRLAIRLTALMVGVWAYPLERAATAVRQLAPGASGWALILSVGGLLCAYVAVSVRRRAA